MTPVVVYDSDRENRDAVVQRIETIAERLGIEVMIVKETDANKIALAGVNATPGIAVDGRLVHTGSMPDVDALEVWLAA